MERPALARDWDLVRDILIWGEHGGARDKRPAAGEVALDYHVEILVQAGLVDGQGSIHRNPQTGQWEPGIGHVRKLTWAGQEFLAAVRSDTIWNKIKTKLVDHGLPIVFEMVKAAALGEAAKLGLTLEG